MTSSTSLDNLLNIAIRDAVINNMMLLYRDRPPLRRYYNEPPHGGYILDEEQNYILPDNDDISSVILLDIISRFGSPGSDNEFKTYRKNQLKKMKYRKVKETDPLFLESCPICIETFCCGEYQRTLECSHVFHKRCIDHWFKKDKDDCPMCRTKVL